MSFLTEWKQFKAQAGQIAELETQAKEMAETIKTLTESEAKAVGDLKIADAKISDLTIKLAASESKQSDFDAKVSSAAQAKLAGAGHDTLKLKTTETASSAGKEGAKGVERWNIVWPQFSKTANRN